MEKCDFDGRAKRQEILETSVSCHVVVVIQYVVPPTRHGSRNKRCNACLTNRSNVNAFHTRHSNVEIITWKMWTNSLAHPHTQSEKER